MGEKQVLVKWKMLGANVKVLMLVLLSFCSWEISFVKASVSYDHKAVIINGQKRILISGSIHYPRSTPEVLLLFPANVARDCWFLLTFCQMGSFYFSFFFIWLQMWPDLIQKAKDGGLDVIQTYVFWNGHEPTQGNVMIIYYIYAFSLSFFSAFFLWKNFLGSKTYWRLFNL